MIFYMQQDSFNNSKEHSTYQPDRNDPTQPAVEHHKLDRQQKISLLVISIIGIGVLVFGFWQFTSGMKIPFPSFANENENNNSEQIQVNDINDEALKNQDSDQDGLSDYDEKYVYSTSPYLEDTDSDGYKDKEEIENGYDPTCPSGVNCFSEGFEETTIPGLTVSAEPGAMTIDEIRNELLSTGLVDGETLASIDDETLMELYAQSMGTEGETVEQNTPTTLQDLQNYTPDQIRAILIQEGLSEEEVNAIDDKTLLEMFDDSLKEAEKVTEEAFE